MGTKLLRNTLRYWVALSVLALVAGCARQTPAPAVKNQPAKPAAKPATATKEKKEAEKPNATPKTETSAGLAELSEADRALAQKQRVCPVSGEVLGEHGKPVKVIVKEQVMFLCCPACEEAVKKNPDKYLARLKPTAIGSE